jgi:hypothetical protein
VVNRPPPQRGQRHAQRHSQRGQSVLDARGDLGEHLARDQAVLFEVAQRLREHLLAHPTNAVAEGGEAVRLSVGEFAQDQHAPLIADAIEQVTRRALFVLTATSAAVAALTLPAAAATGSVAADSHYVYTGSIDDGTIYRGRPGAKTLEPFLPGGQDGRT